MSTYDDFNDPARYGHESDTPGMSGCAKVALGCGIVAFVLMVAVGVGVWWLTANARDIGADFAGAAMKEGLKELRIPDDQQKRIFSRIDDVVQRFKDGRSTLEEVGRIFERIASSPLIPAGMALVVERVYLDESGLDDDEQAAARVVIQRFTHGTIQKSIPEAEVESVLDTISTKNQNGDREFRHPVSDDELRVFIAAAKKAADDAEVAEEVPEVNFADEFDRAIDEALGNAPSSVPESRADESMEPDPDPTSDTSP